MSTVSNTRFHECGPQNKSEVKNNPIDVFVKYTTEKHYSFAKAIYVLGVDVPRALGLMSENNQTATIIKENATLFKLSRSPAVFFNAVNTTIRTSWSYLTGNPIANGNEKVAKVKPLSQVVRDAAGIVNPVNEMATFLTKAILFIPKASIHTLKGVNGIALTFLMGWKTCESVHTLGKNRVCDLTNDEAIVARQTEINGTLLKIVAEVSYVAIGVIMTLAVFAGVAVNPLVLTALSATTVVFSILEFSYKNLLEEKQINLG